MSTCTTISGYLQVSYDYRHLDSGPLEGRECHCIVVSPSAQQSTQPGGTVFIKGMSKCTKEATADCDQSQEKYKYKWEHREEENRFYSRALEESFCAGCRQSKEAFCSLQSLD